MCSLENDKHILSQLLAKLYFPDYPDTIDLVCISFLLDNVDDVSRSCKNHICFYHIYIPFGHGYASVSTYQKTVQPVLRHFRGFAYNLKHDSLNNWKM